MLKKLVQNSSSLFGVLLLVVSLWAISNELRAYNYRDVLNGLAAIPFSRLFWGVGLTCLGYGAMTGYDTLAFGYIGRRIAYKKIADLTGIPLDSSAALGNFETIGWQSAESLVKAIPGLEDVPIGEVAPLFDLFNSAGYGFDLSTGQKLYNVHEIIHFLVQIENNVS